MVTFEKQILNQGAGIISFHQGCLLQGAAAQVSNMTHGPLVLYSFACFSSSLQRKVKGDNHLMLLKKTKRFKFYSESE